MQANKVPEVWLFTEGSSTIGFGHVTRCLAIAEAFSDQGITSQLFVAGDESVRSLSKGVRITLGDWQTDATLLNSPSEVIIFIDSYLAPASFYQVCASHFTLTIAIDDNSRLEYPTSVVLNGNIYANRTMYPENGSQTLLLGSNYLPIRRPFLDKKPITISPVLKNVIITMGGDDVRQLTPVLVKCLTVDHPEICKKVIIGKAFTEQNIQAIEKVADSQSQLIYYPQADGMAETMQQSDVAISAGGQTLFELAHFGLPTVTITVADNQRQNIKAWEQQGGVIHLGEWNDASLPKKLAGAMRLLESHSARQKMQRQSLSLVENDGGKTLVKTILKMYENT